MRDVKLADVTGRCVSLGKLRGSLMLGGETLLIETSRGVVAFEWHSYCGPMPVNRQTGDGRLLDEKHPFWAAVTRWQESGASIQEGKGGALWCVKGSLDV